MVKQGGFEGLGQGEGWWSASWFSQVRWLFRAVCSAVNCVAVSPVVRWYSNGSSGAVLRIFVVIYPQFFATGGVVV